MMRKIVYLSTLLATVLLASCMGAGKYSTMGGYEASFTFTQGEVVSTNTVQVSVMEVLANEEQTKEAIKLLESQAKELKTLIEKCNNKGISTDYEEMHQYILERFVGFLQDDLDCGDLTRVSYTRRVTTKIYEEDVKNLNAYLDGKEATLPELEEQILDWFGDKTTFRTTEYPARNVWTYIVSPSAI